MVAAVLEIAIDARRGSFHLQIETHFTSDWTVIFGPSGSGKSTLLRLLAGLDRGAGASPSGARVVFNDRLLTDTAGRRWVRPGQRGTALVTQETALFPHLTVAQNVAYGLTRLAGGEREARVEEMLGLVDAQDLLHRRPQGLSGGESQRVALARALAPGPKLLLLDEPFSALDGATSDTLLDRLRQWVQDQGIQTVLATHDAADAFATGAEVALLREGRLVALGPANEVLSLERDRLMQRLYD
jgi:ABC-type sulfate/molybdate transport systems ATPase subunit